jgi:hypothetical protein
MSSGTSFREKLSPEDHTRFLHGKYYYFRYYEALWD